MGRKIDLHVHVVRDGETASIGSEPLITRSEMLQSMDERGITQSVLMSQSQNPEDLMSNQSSRDIVQSAPSRFRYMACLDATDPHLEENLLREKEAGAIGIGELIQNLPLDDPGMFRLFALAEQYRLPVLFHLSTRIGTYYGVYDDPGLPRLEKALQAFPQLLFIGHSQAFWFEMQAHDVPASPEERNGYPTGPIEREGRVQALLRTYPNLSCDLSANSGGNAILRDPAYGRAFLEEFSDRLFFGTDTYNKDQSFPLQAQLEQWHQNAELSDEAYECIFHRNFERVFE